MKKLLFAILLYLFISFDAFTQEAKLMLPIGHSSTLTSAQFSSDGKQVLTTSDYLAIIWDFQTGLILSKFVSNGKIIAAFFSPDAKKIYIFNDDNTLKIWDAKSTKLIADIGSRFIPAGLVIYPQYWGDISFANNVIAIPFKNKLRFWQASTGVLKSSLIDGKNSINYVKFAPSGQKFFTNSSDGKMKLWNFKNKKVEFVWQKKDPTSAVWAEFSPNSKRVMTTELSEDSLDIIIKTDIRDAENGKLISSIKNITRGAYPEPFNGKLKVIQFSPDNKTIVSADNNVINIWDAATGKIIDSLKENSDSPIITSVGYSKNGKKIIAAFNTDKIQVWDVETRKMKIECVTSGNKNSDLLPLTDLRLADLSPDSRNIIGTSNDTTLKVFNAQNGKLIQTFKGHSILANVVKISRDRKRIISYSNRFNNSVKNWDLVSGKLLPDKPRIYNNESANLSFDGSLLLNTTNHKTAEITNSIDGKVLRVLEGHTQDITGGEFSPDGKKIITYSTDKTAKIWDVESGKMDHDLTGNSNDVFLAGFSPDGKTVFTITAGDGGTKLWNAETGLPLRELIGQKVGDVAKFTPNGKKIIINSLLDNYANIWDVSDGKQLHSLVGHHGQVVSIAVSNDGKKIATGSEDKTVKIWDSETGALLLTITGHANTITSIAFFPDDKKIVSASDDGTAKVWNAVTGKLQYTFFAVDNNDYLITDPYGRYDGTEGARKLLYFTCGTEVIGLDQVKDQLWVPNLAERIMKGDSINAKKLSDLDICGLIPQVEKEERSGYHFMITPQRGGLGETVLYVNDIEVKRYKTSQLVKTAADYELNITDQELQPYLIAGQENPVLVKAYTAKNDISSRGAKSIQDETKKQAIAPNLYAVMIGISDYKGPELKLKYAAKDATDISDALKASAGKLLGNEHVFTYNLTTGSNHYQLPEKVAIKNVLKEIGKKATANDILLIFFAGHGVTSGEKKQFYFLTADASQASATDAPEQVGISTAELSDWMKPANIKAQKRILILDACNSGQAINELVKVGNSDQNYLAARNDDKAEQIKAIDKLNEKSGLFILAASASNQSAYEMGRYSQGLLTYSLLKAIKQDPNILEDNKYLNVSRWFNAAEKTVSDMVRETGNRQEPQIVSAGNFNIGLVDQEVTAGIKLAEEKPLFTFSNLQNNDPDISADDLHLNSLLDNQLNEISTRGDNSNISYIPGSKSPDAYSIGGRYVVNGGDLTLKVNIRQNDITKYKFELTGKKEDLKILAEQLVKQATDWILKSK